MELLKISEVAKRLQVSRSFAYELAARRTIPTVVIGKSIRVPAEALEEWVQKRTELNELAKSA